MHVYTLTLTTPYPLPRILLIRAQVAVIPVDPSSHVSGGSILGDKTRMEELSRSPHAYVRASPTRGVLGGIAEHTADVISLCECAGYDVVIVESVGLGQSEVCSALCCAGSHLLCPVNHILTVHTPILPFHVLMKVDIDQAVDLLLVIVPPGGGDSLQATKKGIMEAADLVAVNKADGSLAIQAKHTRADYSGSMAFIRPKHPLWKPEVLLMSSRTGT